MSTVETHTIEDTDDPELLGRTLVEERVELVGLMAEYTNVDQVLKAARAVRHAGFTRWDVHSPFPIHGIDAVMGIKPTILPWLVLGMGIAGLTTAILLQWYTNAFDYKFLVSGKPIWSFPANVPVMFELTVLFSAYTAVFGMLLLNRLPRLYNPLFKHDRFRRVTDDRFFVVLDATDPKFDEQASTRLLLDAGATVVERVED
jgi:hypothetical protein